MCVQQFRAVVGKALDQCFPTRIPQNPRISLEIREKLWNKCIKFLLNTAKMFKHPANFSRGFCSAVDNSGVTSADYKLPFCFLSVSAYLRLYLVVFSFFVFVS